MLNTHVSLCETAKFWYHWPISFDLSDKTILICKFDPQKLLKDFRRILKPTGNIFIFTSYNLIGKYHEIFNPVFDTFQFMVWHKTNPIPNIRKSSFLNSCELIVCLWNKGHTWNFTKQNEMHNFIESPICMGKERIKKKQNTQHKSLLPF